MAQEENLEEKRSKLEEFFVCCFEDWVTSRLIIWDEPVRIVVLQKPEYNNLDKHYYSQGLLRIGRKYYPVEIEAGGKLILIKSKPLFLSITWEELEKEIQLYEVYKQ